MMENITVDINKCDLNEDYFHFTNRSNAESILNNGLIPSVGSASQFVGDRPNVSVSQGALGMMGIINSFIFEFSNCKPSEIPQQYRRYFTEILDFESDALVGRDNTCRAMIRKLQDEVYFRVRLTEDELDQAEVGSMTSYDTKLPMKIDKSRLSIITDSSNKVLSAYDVTKYIYEKAKNIEAVRDNNSDFIYMFEMKENNITYQQNIESNSINNRGPVQEDPDDFER